MPMDATKLQQIIADKNEQRERTALRTDECIIENIVTEQKRIADSTARIADLRKELAELEVEAYCDSHYPSTVAGEQNMLVLALLVLYLLYQGGHILLFMLYLTWGILCIFGWIALKLWVRRYK